MIETEINNCIKEFKEMLNSSKYINYNEWNKYFDKYKDIFDNSLKFRKKSKLIEIANKGYEKIEKHNEKYIKLKVRQNKKYFDDMFKDVDSNIRLDLEQRKAIVNEENYSLIIAGAGAGKTTTMAAKVKYLIEKCHVDPEKIIVISYTNKATEELEDRIKHEFKLPVNIMTFHSLGIQIVRKLYDQPFQPVSPKEQEKIIVKYVKEVLFNDKELLNKYVEVFNRYSDYNNVKMFSKGFIDNYNKFETFNDYFEDYKKRKYKENKYDLKKIIEYKIDNYINQLNPRTIMDEVVKSKAEAEIANFLYLNGIEYKYEEPYPEKVDENKPYRPDFTIEVNDIPIYIEYYGLSGCYENGSINEKKKKKYDNIRKIKDEFHRKNKTRYISLDYENYHVDKKNNYIEELKEELLKYNVKFQRRTDKEIYEQILDNNTKAEFFNFVDFIIDLINQIKTNPDRENYKNIIKNYINNSSLGSEATESMYEEFELFDKLYEFYKDEIIPKNKIDFSDMIYYANKQLNELADDNNILDYDYIIIDEYQDISIDRYQFAKNVSLLSKAKVVSVGDDWQTIYSFSGSRIDLFYNYDQMFPGAKKLFINSTYRNSQQLIDVAGSFIMKNPLQIKKNLFSSKRRSSPIKICYYNNNQYKKLEHILDKIYKENKADKVMILARKNKYIEKMVEEKFFVKGVGTRIVYKKHPDMIIDAMSVHSSKGLGADQVILLNVTNSDFPCKEQKEIWLKEIFRPKQTSEEYPNAEDRRIFYVALTRTKKDIYLLTPEDENKRSKFIDEIIM